MAGRTPSEAFREFRELIQEAISCFAHTRVAGTSQEPNEPGILTVNRGKPLSLKATQRQVDITCSISYKIHQDDAEHRQWRVSTLGYIHTVTLDEELFVGRCVGHACSYSAGWHLNFALFGREIR